MSKTALAWVVGLVTGTTLCLYEPIYGLLIYLWDYYNHPPLRWWGDELPVWRWSLLVGSILFAAYTLHGRTIFTRAIFRHRSTQWLVAFLGITIVVTGLFAIDPARSRDYVVDLAKLTLLYCLIIGVVTDYKKYQWVVMALILGALSWGVSAYLDPSFTGGRLVRIGGPDSYNDNEAAAHVVTVLPFLALYFWKGNKWQRLLTVVAAPFIVNMLILCNSRGATIGFAGAMLVGIMLMDWRLRLRLVVAAVVCVPLLLTLVNQPFIDRQLTLISFAEEGPQGQALRDDGAANERIMSWSGAMQLIGDKPLGVGGGGYDALSPVYSPEVVEQHDGEPRAVHNTYLWAASDWGIPGFLAFMLFVASGLRSLHRIRRESADERLRLESLALEMGLIAFLGAAFFVNRLYAEILFWLVALAAVLTNIHDHQAAVAQEPVAPVVPRTIRAA
jgi:O-Antigen ligase